MLIIKGKTSLLGFQEAEGQAGECTVGDRKLIVKWKAPASSLFFPPKAEDQA